MIDADDRSLLRILMPELLASRSPRIDDVLVGVVSFQCALGVSSYLAMARIIMYDREFAVMYYNALTHAD